MLKRHEITGSRKAGAGRLLTWVVVAALLCVLTPAMARAAGIETDTGLLSPPMVDNKPVNVKVGLFLTNLIDVDEVKEMFHISGYLFMTWKDPRLVFSPAGGATDRSYNPDSIWVPRVFMVNAAVQRDKININIEGNPDGIIHYLELFQAELTTSFYLEPFPFDTESLEMFVEPFLDERDTMTLEYDKQVGGVGTEPFVELAQWKILGIQGAGRRHAIGTTRKTISELEIDVVVQRRYRYYIWESVFASVCDGRDCVFGVLDKGRRLLYSDIDHPDRHTNRNRVSICNIHESAKSALPHFHRCVLPRQLWV
jgi:Neurotransmitter-gated ion-channel ligand binding domain